MIHCNSIGPKQGDPTKSSGRNSPGMGTESCAFTQQSGGQISKSPGTFLEGLLQSRGTM